MEKTKRNLSNAFSILIGIVLIILPCFNVLYFKSYTYNYWYGYEINPELNSFVASGFDLIEYGFALLDGELWAGYIVGITSILSVISGSLLIVFTLIHVCNYKKFPFRISAFLGCFFSFLYFVFGIVAIIIVSEKYAKTAAFYPLIMVVLLCVIYLVLKLTNNSTAASSQSNNLQGDKPNFVPNVNAIGYTSMTTHILLLIFTCGIWMYIWLFKTTKLLNSDKKEKYFDPILSLILSMFVPFYSIYWTYKNANKIDNLLSECGYTDSISTICLVLSIFVPIISPIIMQNKINLIAQSSNEIFANADNSAYIKTTNNVKTESESNVDKLRNYKKLLDDGIITQEEFDEKKKQILEL